MVGRVSATLFRSGVAAILALLGTSAVLQMTLAAPSGASGSSVVLLAWGDNSLGQLGNGTTTNSDTPGAVSLPSGVTPVAFAAGGGGGDVQPAQWAAYAIGSDGNLYAWGDNSSGELGNGSTTSSDTPVVVSFPAGVTPTAVSAAQGSAYAIGSDGNLYAWGANVYGELGDGTTTNSDTPVLVSLPAGVTPKAVAGGYESAYAIGSDGNLYAWGDDVYGELGNGSYTDSSTPVVVSLPAGVTPKSIAGGGGAAYAIGSDGNLYAWGLDEYGELGVGTFDENSNVPEVVTLNPGVTAKSVTAGGGFAHAIGSDGNLYGWGLDGTAGQVGDGGSSNQPAPEVITLAPGVKPTAISDNIHTGYAIGSDGKIYAWGYGLAGELGDGSDSGDFATPVAVSLPPGSTSLSLGQEPGAASGFARATVPDAAPAVTTDPVSQTVYAGQGVTFTASASGFPAATVQWSVSTDGGATFSPLSGATSDTLTIADPTTAESGNEYEAVFSNGVSPSATTTAATLTVNPDAPVVTLDPVNTTDNAGEPTSFTAAANGFPTPTVQWDVSTDGGATFAPISGATNDTLNLDPAPADNGNEYEAVFSNGVSPDATTTAATLTVNVLAPSVSLDPANQTVYAGQSATFTAAASGYPPPTVLWEVSTDGGATFSPLSGATNDTLTIPDTTIGDNGNEYEAVFSNGVSPDATTTAATLSVTPDVAPSITLDPVSQTIYGGQSIDFTAAASGTPTPTVEWQISLDGGSTWIDVPALETTTVVGTPPAFWNYMNGWEFRAVFTNPAATATTTAATISVLPSTAPTITQNPMSETVAEGQVVTFTAAASGTPTPTVEWQVSIDGGSTWTDVPSLDAPTITGIPPAFLDYMNGWEFRAVFTNGGGSVTTTAALLTVT
jgi:alpha-tubulin suppressor-like RCC1 family protein